MQHFLSFNSSTTPFPMTVQTRLHNYVDRSTKSLHASDCDDTVERNHDVGSIDQPHVPIELSTPVHHLDERPVTYVNDKNPMSHCHQDADYPGVVPDVPRRSLRAGEEVQVVG